MNVLSFVEKLGGDWAQITFHSSKNTCHKPADPVLCANNGRCLRYLGAVGFHHFRKSLAPQEKKCHLLGVGGGRGARSQAEMVSLGLLLRNPAWAIA